MCDSHMKIMSRIRPRKFNIAEIICILFLTWMEAECRVGGEEMKALHKQLMDGYDRVVRPSLDYSRPTDVSVQLYLSNVMGLDAGKELIYLRAFFRIKWVDEYLQWDPSKFGGLDSILLPQDCVWRPDMLRSSANEQDSIGSENMLVWVSSKGRVSWDPSFFLEGSCKLDMSEFPYDVNECPVTLYAWMSDNNTQTFKWPKEPIVLRDMTINEEFEISSAGVSKHNQVYEGGYFEVLQFKIRLARLPLYFTLSVLLPINLLAILTVVPFIMVPEQSGKVDMAMTVLLSFTVFLDVIDEKIPHTSDNICLLVVYIGALLIMAFLSVVGNVLVVTLKDWDEAAEMEGAKSNNFGSNWQTNVTEDNTHSHGTQQDLLETISLSSSDISKTLITTKQKCRQFFHGTRAAKLNKVFLIIACIFVLLPINLLAILTVVPFIMVPEQAGKVDMAMTVLLSFTVFLDVIDEKIPHTSDNICLLVVYIGALLIMAFLSVVGNVLVVTLKDWDEAAEMEGAKSNNFGSNWQTSVTEDNTHSHGTQQDLLETISLSSSDISKTLITTKQKCRQFFHGTRAAKLNKVFLIIACILLVFFFSVLRIPMHV